jgi:putative phage-type endonuclease
VSALASKPPVDVRAALGPNVVIQPWLSRERWLSSRAESIGASEAAMALGVSPYGTPWRLWELKRAQAPAERGKDILQRGHRWEPAVLAEYADESGATVLDPGKACGVETGQIVTLARRDLPWLRETPDGFSVDRAGQLGQVEAKTALRAHEWSPEPGIVIDRWDDAHAEIVPPHYAIQGYVQLIVTGLPWVDLCALVPRYGWLAVRYVRLQRDPETQDQITQALVEWRERHLIAGEPPPLDGSEPCNRYLAKRFPSPSGKEKPTRGATREEIDLLFELAEINARAKADKERHDVLRNLLLERAQGERLSIGHAYGQPQNNSGKRLVDLDALREEAPELVAKHERKGAPSASFNLYRFDSKVRAAYAALKDEERKAAE